MITVSNESCELMLITHPVVLLSSRQGRYSTLSPLVWYMPVSTDPPMLALSLKPSSTSYHYIRESGDFILAVPDEKLLKAVHFCGVHSGRDVDKFSHLNLTTARGRAVSPLAVTNCLANIECRVRDIHPSGNRPLITGEVLSVTVDPSSYDAGYNGGWLPTTRLVYYLGGNLYRVGNEVIDMSAVRPGYVPPESI
ncbi:MAG: flavin reductase family protein [bacterium]